MSSADTETPDTGETTEDEEVIETDEVREALLGELGERLGDGIVASHIDPGHDLVVRIANEAWADAASGLRRALGFDYFTFLSAIDWMPSPYGRSMDAAVDLDTDAPKGPPELPPGPYEHGVTGGDTRFQALARVYSTRRKIGITLKADLANDEPTIETWTGTYPGADWHEREAWEMFGITFIGHPKLRHIYLPGDFEGNPLRKDFPLLSRQIKPWPGIVDVEPLPGDDEDDKDKPDDSGGEEA